MLNPDQFRTRFVPEAANEAETMTRIYARTHVNRTDFDQPISHFRQDMAGGLQAVPSRQRVDSAVRNWGEFGTFQPSTDSSN
jgi:hypothetical protein